MGRLDELERLQRLRDAGSLDEAEFAAEKARLLRGRRRTPGLLLGAVAAVAATGALGWLIGDHVVQPAPAPTASTRPKPAPSSTPTIAPAERLAAAERAAFPSGRGLETEDGVRILYATGTLVDAPFGPVLVSEGRVPDAAHVESGYVAIHYLRETADGFAVVRAFPEVVKSGSFGAMAEMAVSSKFGDLPVVYTQGGGTWQGYTCGYTSLTELRPDGPAELVSFMNVYEDGNSDADTGTEGKITNIVSGRSFDVRFTGARTFTATYVRRGDRYELQGGTANALEGC